MRTRRLVWLVAGLLWLAGFGLAAGQEARPPVVVGEIKGIINPVMAGYVSRVLDDAERSGAEAVVFLLDTPGGLVDAMRDINQRILAARVPVIVYVAPDGARAGSAGVYITYAAHLAAMAPATNIGSATPVAFGEQGEQQMSPEMRNKVTNDAVAQIRALAEQHGRNAEFAEQAVREAVNLQASEALRQNVVNYVATDLADLAQQLDGVHVRTVAGEVVLQTASAPVRRVDMTALEGFLLTITNPTIAYLLLSLGGLGLVLEMYNPGAIFPGVAGAISVLLAFFALGTLPVNLAALALMVLGLALFAIEPFVVSHGLLVVGGAISFVLGSLLLINAPDTAPFLEVSRAAIAGVTVFLCALTVLMVTMVARTWRRKAVTGREGMEGEYGVARTDLHRGGEGLAMVRGELWRAAVAEGTVPAGSRVVVERLEGLLLHVRPAVAPARPTPQPTPGAAAA